MIITATAEGIEVDGVLLSNTFELQAFINAHQPEQLETYLNAVAPLPLEVIIGAHTPQSLTLQLGINQPYPFSVIFGIWEHFSDLAIALDGIAPVPLIAKLGTHSPSTLSVTTSAHLPSQFNLTLNAIIYHSLITYFWIAHEADLVCYIAAGFPADLPVQFGIWNTRTLAVRCGPTPPLKLITYFRVFQHSYEALYLTLSAVKSFSSDLLVDIHIWSQHLLSVVIKGHTAMNLQTDLWVWTPSDVNVYIGNSITPDLAINLTPEPEFGNNLLVLHRTYNFRPLLVTFNIGLGLLPLSVQLYGNYASDFEVTYRTGAASKLTVQLPMTTGYKPLLVMLKTAARIVSTFIPIYMIEFRELYVSINQGWPCGFGSTYRNLQVDLVSAYFLNFSAIFKVIDGSDVSDTSVYLNKTNFIGHLSSHKIQISLPPTSLDSPARIVSELPISYDNEFDNIYATVIHINFSWPRFQHSYGTHSINVELLACKFEPIVPLIVNLRAIRPDARRQPTSKPLSVREGNREPEYPPVFQVKEIELWADDGSEIVRRIEVLFGEQIKTYYWVSSEQRAYSQQMWKRWTLLTKGYLPDSVYSGQISYVTLRELSEMTKYTTIDEAIRELLANFLYSDKSSLEVLLQSTGYHTTLGVAFYAWDRQHLKSLYVQLQPLREFNLVITLECC